MVGRVIWRTRAGDSWCCRGHIERAKTSDIAVQGSSSISVGIIWFGRAISLSSGGLRNAGQQGKIGKKTEMNALKVFGLVVRANKIRTCSIMDLNQARDVLEGRQGTGIRR